MGFIEELKRRNVFRVGIAYLLLGWVVMQAADFALDLIDAPNWIIQVFFILGITGLPIVLFFAWAFEVTPEGIKREEDVDRTSSITPKTGRKLDRAIIMFLAMAVVLLLARPYWPGERDATKDSSLADTATAETTPEAGNAVIGDAGSATDGAAPGVDGSGELAADAGERSVAVLPFVAMSSGEEDGFFADGLTEEILNALAQLPELQVTARTSSFAFKDEDRSIGAIAETLGVRHIVEGSVRRSGDRLRVTAQLVRAEDGFQLWSDSYDSTSLDLIDVQQSIAEQIAVALDVVLDESKREAMQLAGLRDIEAFKIYQQARFHYQVAHGEGAQIANLREANRLITQVLELTPGYAPAYVEKSDLWAHIMLDRLYGTIEPGANVTEEEFATATARAVAEYDLAIKHARNLRERNSFEFDRAFLAGEWPGLKGRAISVIRSDGCIINNWMGPFTAVFGMSDAFLPFAETTRRCDPLVSIEWFNEARAYLWALDPEGALAVAEAGDKVAPGAWLTHISTLSLVALGRFEEADRMVMNRMRSPADISIAEMYIAAARDDREALDQAWARFRTSENAATDLFHLSHLAWSGQREAANEFAASLEARDAPPAAMTTFILWCSCGAPFDLEATPRFAELLEASNLPWPPPSPIDFPMKDW